MQIPLKSFPWANIRITDTGNPMREYHRHNEVELTLLRSGRLVYSVDARVTEVPQGQFCLLWGGIPHTWSKWEPPFDLSVICLPFEFVSGLSLPVTFLRRLLAGEILSLPPVAEGGLDMLLMDRWQRELDAQESSLLDICCREIGEQVRRIALAGGVGAVPHSVPTDALSRLLKAVNEAATEGECVREIARRAGLHPKYAMRLFKRECGIGIGTYLTQLRISAARRLLAANELSITEVAYASGFGSVSQFYSNFRKATGMAPGKFEP